jgi:hypothetical protein
MAFIRDFFICSLWSGNRQMLSSGANGKRIESYHGIL